MRLTANVKITPNSKPATQPVQPPPPPAPAPTPSSQPKEDSTSAPEPVTPTPTPAPTPIPPTDEKPYPVELTEEDTLPTPPIGADDNHPAKRSATVKSEAFIDTTMVDVSNERVLAAPKTEEDPVRPPTKISAIMSTGIAYLKNVAPGIMDNLVIGETPVVPIAVELIQWVETNVITGKLNGQEKKRLVISLLLWLVDHQKEVLGDILGDDEAKVRDIVQHIMPSVIDVIVAATKGKILINKFVQTSKSLFNICCP